MPFLSRDSLFVWLVKTYRRNRQKYGERLTREFPDLASVRFRRPADAQQWLEALPTKN